jgi:hypothetical protein
MISLDILSRFVPGGYEYILPIVLGSLLIMVLLGTWLSR